MGIQLDLDMQQTERCIREMGVGFLFAPNHHKAMRYAVAPRRELGIRSIFNLLGPLTNPAGVNRFVIGVFSDELCRPIAEVLKQLGAVHVLVVHSKDGLDEISLAAPTTVAELKDGEITEWTLTPDDVGIPSQTLTGLVVNSSEESLKLIKDALSRDKSDIGEKAANMIAIKIDVSDIPHLVDIVGTGGDGQNLFNVSTASSFVIAAAGATIAKHGNRGVSSKSGSSDVLEQMGIQLDLDMQQTERCIREMGVGFPFAPNHHKAMRYDDGLAHER